MSDEKDIAQRAIDALREYRETTPMPTMDELQAYAEGRCDNQTREKVEARLAIDHELGQLLAEIQNPDPRLMAACQRALDKHLAEEKQSADDKPPVASSAFQNTRRDDTQRAKDGSARRPFCRRPGPMAFVSALALLVLVTLPGLKEILDPTPTPHLPNPGVQWGLASDGTRGSQDYRITFSRYAELESAHLFRVSKNGVEAVGSYSAGQSANVSLPESRQRWGIFILYLKADAKTEPIFQALDTQIKGTAYVYAKNRAKRRQLIEQALGDLGVTYELEISKIGPEPQK